MRCLLVLFALLVGVVNLICRGGELTDNAIYELPGGVKLELVEVAPGKFKRDDYEVTISRAFMIGKYEVTQEQYRVVMGNNPSEFNGLKLPVENVSWDDAMAFCRKLNALTEGKRPKGYSFALPTEAQWEYAACGGNQSKGHEYSGSNDVDEVAWNKSNSGRQSHEVGTKKPNELGLYDMSGNVSEWCLDWYDSYPDRNVTDPRGPSSGSHRVNRGGNWGIRARLCRVTDRGVSDPSYCCDSLGFRLVLVPVQ